MDIMKQEDYIPLIKQALDEDLSTQGDVTSQAIFSEESGKAILLSKDTGILAGAEVFTAVFRVIDPETSVSFSYDDGAALVPGNQVAALSGKVCSLLKAERVALNFLSFLSGIATRTNTFVRATARPGKVRILDTRKTLPCFRALSKYAVRVGGGTNHRMGLYDMVLIKDNHIDAAGGITEAVKRIKTKWAGEFRIEVECRTLDDVREALDCEVDVIMLDNMSLGQIKKAVTLINHKVKCEVSGQMDMKDIRQVSKLDVDYISVGKLTKSVDAFDFSLNIEI
ncbi:MAG: carboxylating nicotinate-nucleotide diphosphorylase [Spirochaetales bacterium]|nr:carboxylating nicotinate-nucleotide diphosphorylase [Spirochaetales bacterium]